MYVHDMYVCGTSTGTINDLKRCQCLKFLINNFIIISVLCSNNGDFATCTCTSIVIVIMII
jgi:hypothetical protein